MNRSKTKSQPEARKFISLVYDTKDKSDSSNIFLLSKKKYRLDIRSDGSNEVSSEDDSLNNKNAIKRGLKYKKPQLMESENQAEILTKIMKQLMKKNIDEQKCQVESMVQGYL